MIRIINKIVAFMLIGTSIGILTPKDIFAQIANAAEITNLQLNVADKDQFNTSSNKSEMNIANVTNEVTMASSEEALIATAILAAQNTGESGQLSAINSIIALNISGGTQKVTLSSSPIGNLSYKLTEDKAKEIKDLILAKMSLSEGQVLTQTLVKLITDPTYVAYKNDALVVLGVLSQLQITATKADAGDSVAEAQLITEIQTLASAVPMYQYTGVKSSGISSQGFTAGGLIGLMTTPNETYSAPIRNAIYSLSDTTNTKNYKYATTIDETEKAMIGSVIDGMNISTTVDSLIKSKIKADTFVMIPNIKSDIDNTINGITDTIDDLSDSLDDLTDSINDKSDDVDEAWDKVFDRFDNDEGWGKRDGYIYYYDEDGVSLKGVQKINGKTYYFNRVDGARESGWQVVDGKRCYFNKKKGYQLFNQWIQDNDDWYFLGEDGPVKKMEWVNDGGKNYYLKADGKMTIDWLKIDDYWYYFNKNGSMATSTWKWSDNKWYYLKDNGQATHDWLQLGAKWYYFKDLSGEMQIGWFRANGSWYCSNEDGSMKIGWAYSSDGWCYLDEVSGKMKKNEWVTVNNKKYYFNVNGIMVTGSRYIDGTKYVFNSDGSLG